MTETNLQPFLPQAWCQDKRCRGPPSLPPLLLHTRATSWNTHWAQGHSLQCDRCALAASLGQDHTGLVFRLISLYWSVPSYCLSLCLSYSRPPCLLPAVPVWTSGLPVFSSAGKERSRHQTMSRQACHQTQAPVLRLAQTAGCTETSR